MNLIAAADDKFGIGKDNSLPWRIKEDLKYFKEKTVGHAVIMGKKTLLSLPGGRPLPDRVNVVLTHDKDFKCEGITTVLSIDELFLLDIDFDSAFVIGGGSVYKQLLPYCKTAYITRVKGDWQADTFMDNLDEAADWKLTEKGNEKNENGINYSFDIYENLNTAAIDNGEDLNERCECVCTVASEFDADVKIALLDSCGIKAFKKFPGFSAVAKVYYGQSDLGVMIWTAQKDSEKAREILNAPFDESEFSNEELQS